jgi:hypothetical protein
MKTSLKSFSLMAVLTLVLMAATSTVALAADPAEEGWLDGP